jgi:hypothetical protein
MNQLFFRIVHHNESVDYTPTYLPEDPPRLIGLFRDTEVDVFSASNFPKAYFPK